MTVSTVSRSTHSVPSAPAVAAHRQPAAGSADDAPADRFVTASAPRKRPASEDGARLQGFRLRHRADPLPQIPDARALAADPVLRTTDLNRRINEGYGQFAQHFQAIVDPDFARGGSSSAHPVWFGFAIHASRVVGRSEMSAQALKDGLRAGSGVTPEKLLGSLGLSPDTARQVSGVVDSVFPFGKEARLAATLAISLASVAGTPGALDTAPFGAMLDPRTLACTVDRLLDLAAEAPGGSFPERLGAVAQTILNGLEDGNRRIYGDIGGAAQSYLEFRSAQPGAPSPEQVLEHFSLSQPPAPDQARAIYEGALRHLHTPKLSGSLVRDLLPADTRNFMVAAFALFEKAGQSSSAAERDRLVDLGNVLLAYREQHDSVQPAFTPGRVLPGEVDREKLFEALTPTVGLPVPGGAWSFDDYASRSLPSRSINPFSSKVTEYNWALFEDRWEPILDAFEGGYRNPRAMWPLPSPDPMQV